MKIPDDLWFESNFLMAYKYLFSFFYLKKHLADRTCQNRPAYNRKFGSRLFELN